MKYAVKLRGSTHPEERWVSQDEWGGKRSERGLFSRKKAHLVASQFHDLMRAVVVRVPDQKPKPPKSLGQVVWETHMPSEPWQDVIDKEVWECAAAAVEAEVLRRRGLKP